MNNQLDPAALPAEVRKCLPVTINWMIRCDMPEVYEIENTVFDDPWTDSEFIRALRRRNCIGMTATHSDRVVGYMIYELYKTKLHVLNFAVGAEFQRQGVGGAMVRKLIMKLSEQRRSRIDLEIRETNLEGHFFFRAMGFRAVSVLRGFYPTCNDVAYLMIYRHKGSHIKTERTEPNA